MRKRLLVQIKAHQKLGTAELFDDVDADLKRLLDTRIAEMEERIDTDDTLAETACILRLHSRRRPCCHCHAACRDARTGKYLWGIGRSPDRARAHCT